tara:strand:- start:578 stop:1228 length:651 start_codon:yes stop_codon:yes gene_type:complete
MSDWKNYINLNIDSEKNQHPHCEEERSHLFSAYSGGSTEIETLDFLHSLICLRKPQYVVETGTYKAIGTIAIASALKENGLGKLITIEKDKNLFNKAKEKIKYVNLDEYVNLVNEDSLIYLKQNKIVFDIAFIDSYTPIRHKEFKILYENNCLRDLVLFHDTSRLREKSMHFEDEDQSEYVNNLDLIEKKYCKGSIEFFYSRGLRMMQVNRGLKNE